MIGDWGGSYGRVAVATELCLATYKYSCQIYCMRVRGHAGVHRHETPGYWPLTAWCWGHRSRWQPGVEDPTQHESNQAARPARR